ncbi:MAG: hypothetical protein DYH20_09130 [Gammaproteobacteria bacterium PRO9]|nr:hypothetical protein [Gammaproteobacteria bacterium PRO9]
MARKAAMQAKGRRGPAPKPAVIQPPRGATVAEAGAEEDEATDALDNDSEIAEAGSDNIGEQSVEINVENLIAELEAESHHGRKPDVQCARQKLEDYLERKRTARDLEDFEDW